MTTPTFPTSLPAPLISGYGYGDDVGNVSKSPTTFGYQTQKQIGNTPYTNFSISCVYNQDQMKIWEDFYDSDLIKGHKWFKMYLRIGYQYIEQYCRLPEKYSANLVSNRVWQVGFNIEVDVKNIISEEDYLFWTDTENYENIINDINYLSLYVNGYPSEYTTQTLFDTMGEDNW